MSPLQDHDKPLRGISGHAFSILDLTDGYHDPFLCFRWALHYYPNIFLMKPLRITFSMIDAPLR